MLRFPLGIVLFLSGPLGAEPIAMAALGGSAVAIVPVTALVVACWLSLGIRGASNNGTFAVALHNCASAGTAPPAFSPEVITGAFEEKKERGFLSRYRPPAIVTAAGLPETVEHL